MNFSLSSSSQSSKPKWQGNDSQSDISASMNELRKGIRQNLSEKQKEFSRLLDNQKGSQDTFSKSKLGNRDENSKQQQKAAQISPNSRNLFSQISYGSIGQQQQSQYQHQQQSQNSQKQYSPLKISNQFYSPRVVPSFTHLTKNIREHSAGKNLFQQPQQQQQQQQPSHLLQPFFASDRRGTSQDRHNYFQSQSDSSYSSIQQSNQPSSLSQALAQIETLGPKQGQFSAQNSLSKSQNQQQNKKGKQNAFDQSFNKKSSAQPSPQRNISSPLFQEIDFGKKREHSTSTPTTQSRLASALFSEKRKDGSVESQGSAFLKNNSQGPSRRLSVGSISMLQSSTLKLNSLNGQGLSSATPTPLRQQSTDRLSLGSISGSGIQKKLSERLPISKITELRSLIENSSGPEIQGLPITYVEELTRLAASITKALKSTKFYERNY